MSKDNNILKMLRYICLSCVIVFGLMTIVGTGGGGGGDSNGNEDTSDTTITGTAPTITDVELFYWDGSEWVETSIFYIGESINFLVYVTDPDLDITTLWITQYLPNNSDTPYSGPDAVLLESQSAEDMYYYLIESFVVQGPAGNWRAEFQVEDEAENMSNVFTKYHTIYE